MAGVMNPGQRRTLMDQVAQGLSIAQSVYGIKTAIDEGEYRDEQRAKADTDKKDFAEGRLDKGQQRELMLTKDVSVSKEPSDGALPITDKDSGVLVGYVKRATAPKITQTKVVNDVVDPKTGKKGTMIVEDKAGSFFEAAPPSTKPDKVTYSSFEYTDAKGDKRLGRMTSDGQRLMGTDDPLKETGASGDKASGKIAESFETDYAKKTQIASTIDAELAKFDELVAAGDVDGAVKQGKGMLKGLNAAYGVDAIGAKEQDTFGGFLEPIKSPAAEGSTFGRDLDMFSEQVRNKSSAIKTAAKDSFSRAKKARSEGMAGLESLDATPPAKDPPPKKDGSTAYAGEAPKVGEVKKGYRFKGGDPADKSNWEKAD